MTNDNKMLWQAKESQASPEVQNRGISDPTKGSGVFQKIKNKKIANE